ncbi:uncharacterized protein LOC124888937 [Capsicum annuum]|uniref:uncharacterized protein LOC124888937 n=1 Tax=Capsicum annuum TaxID=4072 RepID=UPI001FB090F5|nr:uncharacterized protein LOC124888937 [Capsicum annuum]
MAKNAAFESLYTTLDNKCRDKKLYMLAKVRERKTLDQEYVKCIKDVDGKVLVKKDHIRKRWQSSFHKLLIERTNTSILLGDLKHSERFCDYGYCRCIRVDEVKGDIRRMRRGRSTIDAIHLVRRLVEQYRERKKDLQIVFIDLKKDYDKVSMEVLWSCVEARGIPIVYVRVSRDINDGSKTQTLDFTSQFCIFALKLYIFCCKFFSGTMSLIGQLLIS